MVDKIHHAYPPYPTHLIHLIHFPFSFYPIHLLILDKKVKKVDKKVDKVDRDFASIWRSSDVDLATSHHRRSRKVEKKVDKKVDRIK